MSKQTRLTTNHSIKENTTLIKDQRGLFGIAYIINLLIGLLLTLLGLRFIFRLFGANPNNEIANFVYTTSQPFVEPFFGLFNYRPELGIGRFEFETLIAIIVYGLLASVIVGAFARRPVR